MVKYWTSIHSLESFHFISDNLQTEKHKRHSAIQILNNQRKGLNYIKSIKLFSLLYLIFEKYLKEHPCRWKAIRYYCVSGVNVQIKRKVILLPGVEHVLHLPVSKDTIQKKT